MTVNITKPEINIREKLTELDYSHVPYEKMPAGSVIQYKQAELHTSSQISTTSQSYQASGVYVDFSPKFNNSIILAITDANMMTENSTNGGVRLTVYRDDYNLLTPDSTGNDGNISFLSPSGYMHERVTMTIEDKPNTTESLRYEMYFKSYGGNTVGIAKDWGGARLTVMEIKQ